MPERSVTLLQSRTFDLGALAIIERACLSFEESVSTYCEACAAEKTPTEARKAIITLSLFVILFSPQPLYSAIFRAALQTKRESKFNFAFPGYTGLRSGRGCPGADSPDYKDTTIRV